MPPPFGIGKQKEVEPLRCVLCGSLIEKDKYKPKKEWNMNGFLCSICHDKKAKYCAECEVELKKKKIEPKKEWNMAGYLCEICYEFSIIEDEAGSGKAIIELRNYDMPYDEMAKAIMQTISDLQWKHKSGDINIGKIEVETSKSRFGGKETIKIFERKRKDGNLSVLVQHAKLTDKSRTHANEFFKTLENRIGYTTQSTIITGNICEICKLAKATKIGFAKEIMCDGCFTNKFGLTHLSTPAALYFGGHKAHLAGGFFSKEEPGNLLLTTDYLIFEKRSKKESERWKIIIPLKVIITEQWTVKEEARRTSALGTGVGFPTLIGAGGVGGGFLHQDGKRHELVVPYIDENGIPQEPRFGVVSLSGKAIKEWAAKLYEVIVEVKKRKELDVLLSKVDEEVKERRKAPEEPAIRDITQDTKKIDEESIQILKLRLAKGEITKEEYEELRKMLES